MSENETIVTDEADLDTEGHGARRLADVDTVADELLRVEPDTDGSDEDPTMPGLRRARR
jgi:hypothetical protein